ncbi:MAG: hypothetical protein AAGF85_21455 [Bacteroidota bacterium]
MQDGEWKYQIQPGDNEDLYLGAGYAKIIRKNFENKTESWYKNTLLGLEEVLNNSGSKTITRWFVSGINAGSIRSEVSHNIKTGKKSVTQYRYNESGKLIELKKPDGMNYSFIYKNGKLREIRDNTGVFRTYNYDKQTDILVSITN